MNCKNGEDSQDDDDIEASARAGTHLSPEQLHQAARNSYIWPLATREKLDREGRLILTEGDGVLLRYIDGDEYLDLTSAGTRASTLGYGREEIAGPVYDQLRRLHYGGSAVQQADVTIELAVTLAQLAPGELSATFFVGSGSEANEAAFKMARVYHHARGLKPRAYKVISRWTGYHGTLGGPMAASDWLGVRHPSEPGVPGVRHIPAPTCYRCPFGLEYPSCNLLCAEFLEQQIQHEGPELVAAFVAEPVMQANGVQVPPPEYLPRVREICAEYEVLFLADEVVTGFGRTGEWFAVDHWGVEPDIMTLAKALTAGYLPLGAVMTGPDVHDAITPFPDVHTYGGHPAAAVAAREAIRLYKDGDLIARAKTAGRTMLGALSEFKQYAIVGDVRGLGMWAALDFTADRRTRAPLPDGIVHEIMLRARKLGVLVGHNGTAIELAPPLTIAIDDLLHGIAQVERTVKEVDEEWRHR